MLIRLRLLDPGRVRLHLAIRTILAALAALLGTWAVCRSADLPGGMVVIATVVAVMISRVLHATGLPHRLSALLYVPAIGILAAFTGRFMLHHTWLGSMSFVGAVGASRYLMRFGGRTRRLGRLALTPLIAVLVVPVPPSAARATGPLWGGLAGLIAVACVVAVQTLLPAGPTRQAAAAARDLSDAITRLRTLPAGSRARLRAAATVHRVALVVDDRLDAARLPDGVDRTPLDALALAVLHAEVAAGSPEGGRPDSPRLESALAAVREHAATVRTLPAAERPTPDTPAPGRRPGGRRDPQPQTRLAAQLAGAMGAAFLVGHLLFPTHWTWTVITAFVVCAAARDRGDVVHRSGLRVAGAFTGALTGTLIASVVSGVPAAGVTVIFCYLLIGVWLRDLNYAIWAFCVTSLLAVLYGLDGERGTALLVQRPEGILLGSACGIAAAFFILPLRTETVMRGRAARALQELQELLGAVREPTPDPTALRRLARRVDRAARQLAEAAAPARAHRRLTRWRPASSGPAPWRPRRSAAESPGGRDPHTADWADSLATCAHAARALAATETSALAAVRPQLGLTAQNIGQVRRRLGHRPDAAPPRPTRGGPDHLSRLNSSLAELYHRLPGPAAPPAAAPEPAPATPAT
ncbi:FUSC family protein [Streptomyces sp. NBC_01190]|uniref:FUSC family protein n=1 Tax=Streptomyces sp. NBC_01190 TaxID=2903767 RepID=UPI0038683777|nr:FUSC family protein [Streptomyces sp. NBC_01190]